MTIFQRFKSFLWDRNALSPFRCDTTRQVGTSVSTRFFIMDEPQDISFLFKKKSALIKEDKNWKARHEKFHSPANIEFPNFCKDELQIDCRKSCNQKIPLLSLPQKLRYRKRSIMSYKSSMSRRGLIENTFFSESFVSFSFRK